MNNQIEARTLANNATERQDGATTTHHDSGGVMTLTKLGGCDDGTCPRIDRIDGTESVLVQGYEPTAGELEAVGDIPAGERVLRIPAHVLTQAAAALAGKP